MSFKIKILLIFSILINILFIFNFKESRDREESYLKALELKEERNKYLTSEISYILIEVGLELLEKTNEADNLKAVITEFSSINDPLSLYSEEEITYFAKVVCAEGGYGDSLVKQEEKKAIATVIMNRLESPLFPDTILEVLNERNPVQFSVTANGLVHSVTPSKEDYNIVKNALIGEKTVPKEVLFFKASNYEKAWKHKKYQRIGETDFFFR